MKLFDLKEFSHVVIYVGGNDAPKRVNMVYFEELYDQVIQYIKDHGHCKIILSKVCPRGDKSTCDVNEIIKGLSNQHRTVMIDLDRAFHDSHGKIIDRYYNADCIHLSNSEVERLLGTINKEAPIVRDSELCVFSNNKMKKPQCHHSQEARPASQHYRQRRINVHQKETTLCYKCGENNHETDQTKHHLVTIIKIMLICKFLLLT